MSIEFIRDDFLEDEKKELDDINKELNKKKPKKADKSVIFLRRFTLALMGQYKFKEKHLYEKRDEIEMLNKQIMRRTKEIHEFRRPIQRLMPTSPINLQAPRPQLQVPTPLKEELKIPKPLQVKKETNIPTPV